MPIRLEKLAILTFRFLALPSPKELTLLEIKPIWDGSGSVAAVVAAVERCVEFCEQR